MCVAFGLLREVGREIQRRVAQMAVRRKGGLSHEQGQEREKAGSSAALGMTILLEIVEERRATAV